MNKTNTKVMPVFNTKIARHLLRNGYKIIDIAPNHDNKLLTVFYFADEKNIQNEIKTFLNK